MEQDVVTIPVCCVTCDSRSLTKSCIKCGVVYCKHHASKIDLRYCSECIGEIKVTESIIEKTVEHIKADGSISFSRKYQAKMIKLEGVDWLFASHLIENMSDADIEATIEFHKSNVDLMLMERQSRQQERARKLAGIKITYVTRKSQHEIEKDEERRTKTKVKTKKDQGQMIMDALTQLAKSGMTQAQIIEMLGRKK